MIHINCLILLKTNGKLRKKIIAFNGIRRFVFKSNSQSHNYLSLFKRDDGSTQPGTRLRTSGWMNCPASHNHTVLSQTWNCITRFLGPSKTRYGYLSHFDLKTLRGGKLKHLKILVPLAQGKSLQHLDLRDRMWIQVKLAATQCLSHGCSMALLSFYYLDFLNKQWQPEYIAGFPDRSPTSSIKG